MKAIILAAGVGSRLQPLTNNIPKSLLNLYNGERIIDRTIRLLKKCGINDITIVVGYQHKKFDEISEHECKIVFNPFYEVSNSIVSLWFARDNMDSDTIILNSDVIFSEELLANAIKVNNEATVLLDTSVKKEADYKVEVQDDKVVVMSKNLDTFFGEYIGITVLNKVGASKLKQKVCQLVDHGMVNEWYETALVEMIYLDNFDLHYFDVVDYHWIEIDNINDLASAKKMVKKS